MSPDPAARCRLLAVLGRHPGPLRHRRGDDGAARRGPLGRRHPGAGLRARACSRTSSSDPSPSACIGPLGDRFVGLGRKLVRADTAKKIQYRLDIAGNPTGWDVNRIIGLKVLGLGVFTVLGFLYLLGSGWPLYRVVVATAADRGLRLRAAQHPALQRRAEAREADAQRAARRPGPADGLGRGRPGLRRRRSAGVARTPRARWHRSSPVCCRRCRSASAAPKPCERWPSAPRSPTSSPSAWPWSRLTASASRSGACCASRAARCAPSVGSGPRRRPSRCRCGS